MCLYIYTKQNKTIIVKPIHNSLCSEFRKIVYIISYVVRTVSKIYNLSLSIVKKIIIFSFKGNYTNL